jgi:PAS domain S-box-containing protein
VEALLRLVLETGESLRSDHHVRTFPNGTTHSYSFNLAPMEYEGLPAVLVMLWETTAMVLARQQAEGAEANQRRLTEQNRDQGEFLEHLLDSSRAGFFALDASWRFTYVNQRVTKYTLFTRDEMVGRSLWEVSPQLENDPVAQVYRQVMVERKPLQTRSQSITQPGKWYDMHVSPFRDGISVFFTDASAQVEAEQALRKSETRFRELADAMPQLVWTARPDGQVDYYNRRYQEFNGIAPAGDGIWDWNPVLHPEDVDATVHAWTQAVGSGEIYQIEHRVLTADGSYRWFLSRGLPARDEQGAIVKWYGTATDIHDLKQAERELQDREDRLQRMLGAAQVGIVFALPDGSVTAFNEATRRIFRLGPQDVLEGISWRDFIVDVWGEQHEEGLNQILLSGHLDSIERQVRRKDGSLVWVLVSVVALDSPDNEFIAFVVDISEQKAAERALQEYTRRLEVSNKELEQFAFIASHDLNEPLRKIEVFSSAMRHMAADRLTEQEQDYLRRLNSAALRMRNMINDLLELSRVTTRIQPFSLISLNEIIRGALSDLDMRLESSRGRVEVGQLPEIYADPLQIRRLFVNLLGNALKFHRQGVPPVVRISGCVQPSGEVEIRVEDNGIGFEEAHKEIIFQPFRRLVGRSEFDGSGIGLAICRKIVERHGGRILVESQPGQGSTFKIVLPVSGLEGP